MGIDWAAVQKELIPIKDYADLCQRMKKSFSYPFVRDAFNFSMPTLIGYTKELLGGDSRQRYTAYASRLVSILQALEASGTRDVVSFIDIVTSAEELESFSEHQAIDPLDLVFLAKYLVYWFIPGEKYLSGIVPAEPGIRQAVKSLGEVGIRSNLDLLQAGLSAQERESLAARSGLPVSRINDLVNRADFSRLPWASKATIANIIGSGCPSLADLAAAEPERLFADFLRYGKSIGKNLKLGNEIENSYRIARIVPKVVV